MLAAVTSGLTTSRSARTARIENTKKALDGQQEPGRGPQGPRGLKTLWTLSALLPLPVAVRKDRED